MNAIGISLSVLVFVVAVVVARGVRPMRAQMAGYASQRMCPACGLITPRAQAACLECGAVLVSAPVGREGRE